MAGTMAPDFFRPYGTRFPLPPIPTVETVGYCRASLRDKRAVDTPTERGWVRSTTRSRSKDRGALDTFERVVRGETAAAGPLDTAALRSRKEARA